MKNVARIALCLVAAVSLGACARDLGGASVDSARVGQAQNTERGVVRSVRAVNITEGDRLQDNVGGGLVGGVAGGLIGSQIGGGRGAVVATGLGALAGAAAGAAAQRETSRQTGFEYVVEVNFGRLLTVVQTDAQPIPVGTQVFVMTGGGQRSRITPAF